MENRRGSVIPDFSQLTLDEPAPSTDSQLSSPHPPSAYSAPTVSEAPTPSIQHQTQPSAVYQMQSGPQQHVYQPVYFTAAGPAAGAPQFYYADPSYLSQFYMPGPSMQSVPPHMSYVQQSQAPMGQGEENRATRDRQRVTRHSSGPFYPHSNPPHTQQQMQPTVWYAQVCA